MYIFGKKNNTNRDLLEVMCDPTEKDQFCLLSAMLFLFCISSSVNGGGQGKQS